MSQISIVFMAGGAPRTADVSARLRDVTGTFGIKRNDTGAVVVTPTAPITAISTGTYTYNIDGLGAGNYTAIWEFVDSIAGTVYVPTVFDIDVALATPVGVSLSEIEQIVSRLTGPYYRFVISDDMSTVSTVSILETKSRRDTEMYEDLYCLRRGVLDDGSAVQGFTDSDRVRSVYEYDNVAGSIQVDRDWTNAPVENEVVEFSHLHPDNIRYAVKEGLKRCFFMDLITVTTTTAGAQRDLSSSIPWLKDPSWIYRAEWNYTGGLSVPGSIDSWTAHREGMTVQYRAWEDAYPNTLQLKVARPFFSLVNGVASLRGPDDDSDIVPGPAEYAAAAGHVECWRHFPARMLAAAEEGYQIGRQEAVQIFEAMSQDVFRTFPSRQQGMLDPFGWLSSLSGVRVN